ncbi:MAG: hypothetical protein ACLRFL_01980 [Clostridia bacterium]
MKKISSLLLILITMVSCCFLTACGDKYSKLKMTFESISGETLESVNFVIDDDNEFGGIDMGVRFSDIEKKHIGEIEVRSEPEGLITVSNYSLVGSLYTFRVEANSASDNAKLIVRHMSSNKSQSIDLTIDQKSKNINVNNSKYVVDISNKESRYIDFTQILTMYPTGSTDKIQFALKDGETLPTGITPIKRDSQDLNYSGFSFAEDCGVGNVKIYPITTMHGYEDTKYENEVITIHFIDGIEEIGLVSKEAPEDVDKYIGYGSIEDPIYLLANGGDADVDLRSYMVGVQYLDGSNYVDIGTYLEYYTVNAECDDSNGESNNIMTSVVGDGVVAISATAHTNNPLEINVSIVPNGYVGEIQEISQKLYVKGVMRPNTVEMSDGSDLIDYELDSEDVRNYEIDVYNYYEDSTLGKKFTFKSITFGESPVLDGMDKIRIVISADLIDNDGNIYLNDTFTETTNASEFRLENGDTKAVGSSRYLLDFHLETDERVRFYWNGKNMVSEPIDNNSKIYIITKGLADDLTKPISDLEFVVSTINEYGKEELGYTYLSTAQSKHINVNVNRMEGVKALDVYMALGNDTKYETIKDPAMNVLKNASKIYINRNNLPVLNGVEYPYYYLYLSSDSAKGPNKNTVNNVDFELSVTADSNKNNPLILSDGVTVGNSGLVRHETISYIKLKYYNTTDVGEYTISFIQPASGFSKSINIYIYETISDAGLSDLIDLPTDDKFFKNSGLYDTYLSTPDPVVSPVVPEYGEEPVEPLSDEPSPFYDVYIINSGRAFDIEIMLTDALKASEKMGFIEGYAFEYDMVKYDNEFKPANINGIDQYFSRSHTSATENYANISFKQGTYIGGIRFVKLTAEVSVKTYTDVLTEGESLPITYDMYFFIYDEIKDTDISLDRSTDTVYARDYLGVFDKEDSQMYLDLVLDENLWHYTQIQQDDNKTKWGINSNKVIKDSITDTHAELTFNGDNDNALYQVEITASIKQFGRTFTKTCKITVRRPIITERVILNSHSYEDTNGQSYIYMKLGENNPYNVEVTNYSSYGLVTNPGVEMIVVDEMNVPSDQFVITGNTINAKLDAEPGDYYLIIFARDALKLAPSVSHGGYDHPEDFIMESVGPGGDQYKNAFFRLKISLADGSEEYPYLIHSAQDFASIEGKYNYKLMNNINLSSLHDFKGITEFNGRIFTEGSVRTIGGIRLHNDLPNIITSFGGVMENIMFEAIFDFVSYDKEGKLGIIGTNIGELRNVFVDISGQATATKDVYLGGLVGHNAVKESKVGLIAYTDKTKVGANIDVNLGGTIYFGGLVGLNDGTIQATAKSSESVEYVDFSVSLGDQGSIANVNITALSTLKAVGGIVGKNTGYITNAYVTGIIDAGDTDNVGGAIGINEYYTADTDTSIEVTLLKGPDGKELNAIGSIGRVEDYDYKVSYITSTVRISARHNVGGIIGYNNSGIITECHYQIVPTILEINNGTKAVAIIGNSNVGGLVGKTTNGLVSYSSVYSYRWDYSKLEDIDNNYDISGTTNVAGLVGLAQSENTEMLSTSNYHKLSAIIYSSANGNVNGHGLANYSRVNANEIEANYVLATFNAYFLGKGDIEINSILNQNVYLKKYDNSSNTLVNTSIDNFKSSPGKDYWGDGSKFWGDKATLNGGYIYVTRDEGGKNSLFEVAPTDVSAVVRDGTCDIKDKEGNIIKEPNYTIAENINKLLVLNYYDFNSADIDIATLNNLNNEHNTHSIQDYIRFGYAPSDLSGVRLYIESKDPSIVSIESAGKIRINSTGKTTLKFISVLNPAITTEIDIIVITPIGDYEVSDNLNDPNMSSLSIAKGKSKLLYNYTSGEIDGYSYVTNANPYLNISVATPNDVTLPANKEISDYILIIGIDNSRLSNTLPFTIKVLDTFENAKFEFTVKPYTLIKYNEVDYYIYSSIYTEENELDTFDLYIGEGGTGISLNYSGALLYPADRTIITAYLETDLQLDQSKYQDAKDKLLQSALIGNIDVSSMINVVSIGSLNDDGVQPIYFELIIDENEFKNESKFDKMTTIELVFQANENEDITTKATFDILPQKIEKIDINNYTKNGTEWVLTDMIKPASKESPNGSLLRIDMVPINAYFDYLEIRDITGSELIKFIQVKNDKLEALDLVFTDDGLGIRLYPQTDDDTIYVQMMIESTYTTKAHTLEVTAYALGSDGTVYNLYSETKQVEAKMLPKIETTYVLPNGVNQNISNDGTVYLAAGTDAEFRINVTDATAPMTHTLTYADGTECTDYELVLDQGLFYILKYVGDPIKRAELLGKTIKLTLTAVAEEENGEYEETTHTINFTLVEYQIHSVSVSPSMNGDIYGLFNRPVDLSFYFAPTDISYYGRESNNTEYRHTDDRTKASTDNVLKSIYDILDALNPTGNDVPEKQISPSSNVVEFDMRAIDQSSNKQLTINVVKETKDGDDIISYVGDEKIILSLYLKLENNLWIINAAPTEGTEPTIKQEYGLNFIDPSSKKEPIIITSEKEFTEMASGPNTYYALGKDLEFYDYVPLNVNVTEFDGNGHKITIRGFVDSENADVKLGVFSEIPAGMLVKNLTVEYPADSIGYVREGNSIYRYQDLTDSTAVNYTAVSFGGIASVNNGIITNCKVMGTIAVHASVLESRGDAMTIGGLVATNSSTGYITHSSTELNIYSQSNIGGLVYENAGTIASSYNKNAKIYAYNKNLSSSIIVKVAGFVVDNSGSVSMSYIELDNGYEMSAKDISAGFILNNSGDVSDCYSIISKISYSTNSNYFSGFVDTNSGRIERSYSYINAGQREDNNMFMFFRAGQNSGEMTECIEIVNSNNYSQVEKGLDYVSYSNSRSQFINSGYSFGNNLNINNGAVWTFEFGLPRLVSTKENIREEFDPDGEGDEYVGRYIIYKKIIEETEDGENTKYVEYLSRYGTKDNPFIVHDINSWNEYMMDYAIGGVNTNYFRIVADIDFSGEKDNPKTSTLVFAGDIQGNNMTLSNIILKSNNTLSSIGLFASMEKRDGVVDTKVRNLTLTASSVWATKTQSVGILAGIIENFDLYNIYIDSENITVVGGNAVGGLAGIIRGNFDMDMISSNVGVNSTRVVATSQHYIYSSINNQGSKSNNISNVYYAGSIAGILDGYDTYTGFDINDDRIVTSVDNRINNYYQARNISVSGSMVLIGDIVGSAFGFVGERVQVDNANISLTDASIKGSQYSSGLVGENRGVITRYRAKVVGDQSYALATGAMGGLVGLNLGGLVRNSAFEGDIINNQRKAVIGGIIGRNINGTLNNVEVSGKLYGHFAGGIVGADYTKETLIGHSSGYGALANTCKSDTIIPSSVKYIDSEPLAKFTDLKMSIDTLQNMLKNIESYYSYDIESSESGGVVSHTLKQTRYRVLGLSIAISDVAQQITDIEKVDNAIVFNQSIVSPTSVTEPYVEVSVSDGLLTSSGDVKVQIALNNSNQIIKTILPEGEGLSDVYQVYLTGAIVVTFDYWNDEYSNADMLILGDLQAVEETT